MVCMCGGSSDIGIQALAGVNLGLEDTAVADVGTDGVSLQVQT